MIFDPRISALYGDDGSFIKTVHCPMALRVHDLQAFDESSPDRSCNSCGTTVRCIDEMSEAAVREAVADDGNICVFATARARHVVFLQPIGRPAFTGEQLPRIQTTRTLEGMADAFAHGMRVVIQTRLAPSTRCSSTRSRARFGGQVTIDASGRMARRQTGLWWPTGSITDRTDRFP